MTLVFFTAYALFLSPVIVALYREFMDPNHPETTIVCSTLSGLPFVRALAIWLGFLVVCYMAMSRIPKIKRKQKSHAMHVDDVLRLAFLGTMMFAVGGIGDRIEKAMVNRQTGLTFIPLTVYFTLFFTLLYELIKHENVTLSRDLSSNVIAFVITLIGGGTLAGVIVSLFLRARAVSDDFFHMFAGLFLIGFIFHAAGFLLAPLMKEMHVHIHHYYWPIPFMFMCVFHSDVAMIAQAIFVGVHIHGMNCFGVEPLLYDTADHDPLKTITRKERKVH